MQLCHTSRATSAVFDDPNLVSSAGLIPVLALARTAGVHDLAQTHMSVPTDKGANAGLKVTSLVAGMVAGGAPHTPSAKTPASAIAIAGLESHRTAAAKRYRAGARPNDDGACGL